ncbi:hypothetical protein BH23GEM3_BH23GEM3_06930 [soil metagenome]
MPRPRTRHRAVQHGLRAPAQPRAAAHQPFALRGRLRGFGGGRRRVRHAVHDTRGYTHLTRRIPADGTGAGPGRPRVRPGVRPSPGGLPAALFAGRRNADGGGPARRAAGAEEQNARFHLHTISRALLPVYRQHVLRLGRVVRRLRGDRLPLERGGRGEVLPERTDDPGLAFAAPDVVRGVQLPRDAATRASTTTRAGAPPTPRRHSGAGSFPQLRATPGPTWSSPAS